MRGGLNVRQEIGGPWFAAEVSRHLLTLRESRVKMMSFRAGTVLENTAEIG